MAAALMKFVVRTLDPSWLTGPILDKELRTSSRKRRNYVLRFVYLALLTVLMVLVWLEAVQLSGSSIYTASRMAQAGQAITIFIVWFQFCATQLVAIIMLSTSISDEVYNRTLGVLMTTPINSFQIVTGKLFSKLLQLLLLLGISIPLLAVIRVFGGVQWDYLLSSLCITFTTLVFLGSMSLFFSIFCRQAYVVIILTIITAALLFGLIPLLIALFWHIAGMRHSISENTLFTIIAHFNPYLALGFTTDQMANPSGMARSGPSLYWPLHCGIMLAGAAMLLSWAVARVRKVALAQVAGDLAPRKKLADTTADGQEDSNASCMRVNGSAVIWKETRLPLLGRRKVLFLIAIFIGASLLLLSYILCGIENMLHEQGTQIAYTIILTALGLLFTIVLPATSITSEKESRAWPLLLATTIDDWEILFGKFVGAVRRCLPAWMPLFAHLIFFSMLAMIRPVAILQMALVAIWIIAFFCGTGIYFSTRFRHSTTAVVMNFALAAALWAVIPLLLALMRFDMPSHFVEGYINIIPLIQAGAIISGTTESHTSYDWPGLGNLTGGDSTCFLLLLMFGYTAAGCLFAWRAKTLFRRKIF